MSVSVEGSSRKMKKPFLVLLIAFALCGCASKPSAVTHDSRVGGFVLDAPYDSIAGIGKFKITLAEGHYRPVYKDAEGVYFFCDVDAPGVFVASDKSEAWIIMLAHKPEGGAPFFSSGAIPVLISALVTPPGSVSKARQLKADFFSRIRWEEPIQASETTRGK